MDLFDHQFVKKLEWEFLATQILISTVDQQKSLPNGKNEITIKRNGDYDLEGVLRFTDPVFFNREPIQTGPVILPRINITGYDSSFSYTLDSAVLGSWRTTGSPGSKEFYGTVDLHFNGLILKKSTAKKPLHLSEWYVNGPRDSIFTVVTERKLSGRTYSRVRRTLEETTFGSVKLTLDKESKEIGQVGADGILVKNEDFQFLIGNVPKKFGPNWSSNVSIEYDTEWGGIPDLEKRGKILNLCSLILGRQLLSVGYTFFDEDANVVEAYARDPWGHSAKALSQKPDWPPISIEAVPPRPKAAEIIGGLLPSYCALENSLSLKEGLWNYWISRDMPLGTNLPILAAGVESIINAWFRSSNSVSKGVYLPREDFEKLLHEELENIKKKLKSLPEDKGKKIIGKIERANEFGMIDNYRKFFEEIKLQVKKNEWNALTGRHVFVHGGALFDKTNWNKVADDASAFETLFSKIMLKILGYSADYIDRSSQGWPNATLS